MMLDRKRQPLVRRVVKAILRPYLRLYHRLKLENAELLPAHGPAIFMLNHASVLDVPALMVLDPYPDTATVVKASLFKVPVVSWLLSQWAALPVERHGRDSSSVRAMLGILRDGGVLAIAAEGRRTRTGHLEHINPVLARIAVSAGVPIVPLGIRGSYRALPPGALFPRPVEIAVRVGPAFHLKRGTDPAVAAARIRAAIAALLPPEMQPLD
jgi:1-acyl-sn-glycerol-3-phosphate acyltransferase